MPWPPLDPRARSEMLAMLCTLRTTCRWRLSLRDSDGSPTDSELFFTLPSPVPAPSLRRLRSGSSGLKGWAGYDVMRAYWNSPWALRAWERHGVSARVQIKDRRPVIVAAAFRP